MTDLLSSKQLQYVLNSTAKWNIAHGPVRSGKTIGTLFRFMQYCYACPDSELWMIGHSSETIYQNAIRLLFESPQFAIFKPFLSWSNRKLRFRDKTIGTLGAKDEGAIGSFQGKTFSGCYCDEITLYPKSIIQMIDTRLSKPHSAAFVSCNPTHPDHIIKQWIDEAKNGNKDYYEMQFMLDDNPFVDEEYKNRVRNSLSGVFYKRNYLGHWCLAEGSIFDFFDRDLYVVDRPPESADYWIAAIDYGTNNPFCCLVIGVSTGIHTQRGKHLWVEKEYYYDQKITGRQKSNLEYAEEIAEFLEPYTLKGIYVDPSAAALKVDLKKQGLHVIDANNDVEQGIITMTGEMKSGRIVICKQCKNTIREIEGYVWDEKAALKGEDKPLKVNDHAIDCLRYALHTHKVAVYNPYNHNPNKYMQSRFGGGSVF